MREIERQLGGPRERARGKSPPSREKRERCTDRLAQVALPARLLGREPHRIPHHAAHDVVAEEDELLAEPPDPARVAPERQVGDAREEGLGERVGEGGAREGGGRVGVGWAGDEEEVRGGEEGGEGREERGEGCEELCGTRERVSEKLYDN